MRKKPLDIEKDILVNVWKGKSYEYAASPHGASKSTVNRMVEDFRKAVPDFDETRELNQRLKKQGLTVLDVLHSLEGQPGDSPKIVYIYLNSQEKSAAAQYLESVLANRTTWIPCKNCQNQFQIRLKTAETYQTLIWNSQSLFFACPFCRNQLQYNSFEILGFFGLALLHKEDENIVRLDI